MTAFTVQSQAISEGAVVGPAQLIEAIGGQNLSPDLTWDGAPEGTRSFAITLYDPDAPTGSGYWHWIAYDLAPAATSLAPGQPRTGAGFKQAFNDYGLQGYDGPNPPAGEDHRYIFTVHALSIPALELPEDAPHVNARFQIHTHELGRAQITTHYKAAA